MGSILGTVEANGTHHPPPRPLLLQLLSLLHAAGVFLDRIASFESCKYETLIPARAAGSLVLGIKPGNNAAGHLRSGLDEE